MFYIKTCEIVLNCLFATNYKVNRIALSTYTSVYIYVRLRLNEVPTR